MTCRRSDEIDLPAYLVDPGDEEFAEFRAHYPTCADCWRAVQGWTRLEEVVRRASRESDPEHPAEALLLAFNSSPEELRPEERESVRSHLEGCPACRNDLAALATFDFAALQREYAANAPRRAVAPPQRERLLSSLRNWLESLSLSIPVPALATVLVLLLAVPSALAIWWLLSERGVPSSTEVGTPTGGLQAAATDSPVEGLPEPGLQIDAPLPPLYASEPSLALETPTTVPPGAGPSAELEPPLPTEIAAPRASATVAEVAPPPATREATQPPLAEAPEEEPDRGVIVLAMASLDPPFYAKPSWGVSPARVNIMSRRNGVDLPVLRALVPDHTALTLRESPVLYWFTSKRMELRLDLTVVDEESIDPVLEVTLDTPVAAGIHAVNLPDYGVKLAPGVAYKWFVSISIDDRRTTHDVVSGGVIQRIEPTEALQRELAAADPAERGHTLAANGVWYDALDFFSDWIERDPGESKLREQRAALLQQAGLSEVADYERRARGSSPAQ